MFPRLFYEIWIPSFLSMTICIEKPKQKWSKILQTNFGNNRYKIEIVNRVEYYANSKKWVNKNNDGQALAI